jgi:hypothetical protein
MSKGGFRGAKDGKPFVKGDSRINKKGRPPELPDLKELLAKILGEETNKKTALEHLLRAFIERAIKGDLKAGAELMDRAYGKAKQSQDLDITLEKLEKLDEEDIIKITNNLYEREQNEK